MHAIKPSQRKSLAVPDDITASGINAFNTLGYFQMSIEETLSAHLKVENVTLRYTTNTDVMIPTVI